MADERLFPRVHAVMYLESSRMTERQATVIAHKLLGSNVYALMCLQERRPVKKPSANRAAKRLACMPFLMLTQLSSLRKCLATVTANKRFHSGVQSFVSPQRSRCLKWLAAFWTGMQSQGQRNWLRLSSSAIVLRISDIITFCIVITWYARTSSTVIRLMSYSKSKSITAR